MEKPLIRLMQLLRYRFLLIAGLLPYCLGAAVAFHFQGRFNLPLFIIGLIGLSFVLIGVEAFNEFFDWRIGTDRVFQLNPNPVTLLTFFVGIASFFVALIIAILLTLKLGVMIIILSLIGFLAALFYLVPPIKLAYRGFGELIIALSYGPLMMLGSYYVQIQEVSFTPLVVSIIPALLLFGISILNEVPDFFQDRLVGKQNICVRIGQKNVLKLYGGIQILFYVIFLVGLSIRILPAISWVVLCYLPISSMSYTAGMQNYANPHRFVYSIRYLIIQYVFIIIMLSASYIIQN